MQNHTMRLIQFKKVKDQVNLDKWYWLFNIFELEMCKFIYLQYNNLLPEAFAEYFGLVLKSHSLLS